MLTIAYALATTADPTFTLSPLFALEASGTVADPVAVLVNYGAIGLLLMMFILGKLHSDRELNDLKEQNAKLTEALTSLQTSLTTNTLPALTRSTQILEALPRDLPKNEAVLVAELERMVARLESIATKEKS